MTDLENHPFSAAAIAREAGIPDDLERAWLAWVAKAERMLGHDLDGNDPDFKDGVGYSLDEAYMYWDAGKSAHVYVTTVIGRARYDGGASVKTDPITTVVAAAQDGLDPALAASIAAGIARAGKE